MRLISKKNSLFFLLIVIIIGLLLSKYRIIPKYINIFISICLMFLLTYEIFTEIGENYENKDQDKYVLSLVEKINKIHPAVTKITPKLKFFEGRRSYTINKTYVNICKKDENGDLYPQNQLMLVLLHEIAHALCDEVGHTEKFQNILDELLVAAEKHKLYDPKIPHVQNYCQY